MIILASQSPRRAELLEQVGVRFRAEPAAIDEGVLPGEAAPDYVQRIAIAKARAVQGAFPDRVVLGADTAVVLDRTILGKPCSRAEGMRMLGTLAGRMHEVLTGVVVLSHDRCHYRLSRSRVVLRSISPRELAAYWATGEPCDKAGGYAVQGFAAMFIEHIEGSYSGIMGLPLFETMQLLNAVGVRSDWDV